MNLKRLVLLVFLIVTSGIILAADFPNLVIMTEEYAPFNFKKSGKVQGIAVDMMVEMLKKIGSDQTLADIKLLPWARGYRDVQAKSNAVLFSATRTKERENMFKWVCPINTLRTEVIALKSRNIKIDSAQDLLSYKIGVVRDAVGEQTVIGAGVPKSKLDRNSSYVSNVKKLNLGRIDLNVSSLNSVIQDATKSGIDPDKFESVYLLNESHLCYAFNKGVSDQNINKLQKALDKLIADGTFAQISKKYGK